MHTTLLEALDHHARVRGDTVFTRHVSGGQVQELTFAQFAGRAADYAARFQAVGVGKADVVLIFLPTSTEALPAFLGAMRIGAIPSFMPLPSVKQHPSIYWPSHERLLDRIQPRLLLTDRVHAEQMAQHGLAVAGRLIVALEDLPPPSRKAMSPAIEADDIALLQHSSGTTALKKGVALSHRAILRQAESYAARLGATAQDAIVSWLPIYHDMGLIACSMVPLVLGQTVTILDPFQWVARPATLFEAIARYDGRFVWLPNFAFEHLARTVPDDCAVDLSGVRAFIDCSEPCKTETFDRFAARFATQGVSRDKLHVCYAMAETVFAVSQTVPGSVVGSAVVDRDAMHTERVAHAPTDGAPRMRLLGNGRPIDGITVQIRDDGKVLDENRIGEIVVTGDFLFTGYFNDPATTAERLVDGWYHTRDLGFLRDGELYVLGRKDDLLIVNGRNLHAHEVEAIVAATPGLKPGRAVAFGVFNATNASEELVIVAERDESAPGAAPDDREIARLVRDAVFDHTNIEVKDVSIVTPGWLVKTTSGKISREKNRDRYLAENAPEEGVAATPVTESADGYLRRVARTVRAGLARWLASAETRASASAALVPEETTATEADDGGIFGEVARVIGRTFRIKPEQVTRETVAADVTGWDSLAHSTLMLEIERELRIRFPDEEIFSFENVGALADRAAELVAAGGGPSDRIIAKDENFSVIAMGAPSDAPDLVIFAGAAMAFGGQNMMDFASTLHGTSAERSRRLFVTSRTKSWFLDSNAQIIAALNAASPGPKVVIGNSMGGYGALWFAPKLENVLSVLAFVPQVAPPRQAAAQHKVRSADWGVKPTVGVPTCIVFGEIEDSSEKRWVAEHFVDKSLHTIVRVRNCGHNAVGYLSKQGVLGKILIEALAPETMGANVDRIISTIKADRDELQRRVDVKVNRMKQRMRRQGKSEQDALDHPSIRQLTRYVARRFRD